MSKRVHGIVIALAFVYRLGVNRREMHTRINTMRQPVVRWRANSICQPYMGVGTAPILPEQMPELSQQNPYIYLEAHSAMSVGRGVYKSICSRRT